MFCSGCGKEMSDKAAACPHCGHPNESAVQKSPKSKTTAILLCFFLGVIGVHRFYVGKVGSGIAQILTFGGFGIWSLVDLIVIICGNFKDAQGRLLA